MTIRSTMQYIALVCMTLAVGTSVAQEHFTDGPVWQISTYQIADDQGDAYAEWLRAHVLPANAEAKKQGLIVDWKVFLQERTGPNDWDVAIATLYSSYGKAMDYDATDEAKWEAIQAAIWKSADKDKQREAVAPRLAMRKYLGTRYVREVTLKPMP